MQQIKNYYWYKTYVRVVTLSTQDNVKLVKQLSFQGINRRFVLSGKDRNVRENYNKYIFFNCIIKRLQCYDQWKKSLWWTSKNDLRTYDNIWKIETGQGDNYTTGCFLDYPYFKEYYKLVAIYLNEQQ